MTTWLRLAADHPYGIGNLPYGVFAPSRSGRRIGVRIGDWCLDLHDVETAGLIAAGGALRAPWLDDLLAGGRPLWTSVRRRVVELLTDPRYAAHVEGFLLPVADVTMLMPFQVADYVDFYSFEHHATNLGRLFRPDSAPLLPNWKHLPVGYHGRGGTVVVSGTDIVRPRGQRKPPDAAAPRYGPSVRLDIEAEVGFVVGAPSRLGEPVPPDRFADHVFGVVLVNDWSARDIQAWEYQPLGPFLGKSFATSISPWVVPLDALTAARVAAPPQDPAVLDYLREDERYGYDLRLTVRWNDTVVSEPPFRDMYWTPAQQLAHLTANGASLRTGDLYASGTVSGAERDQVGSFLELTWSGAEPVKLADGSTRTFLEDGDTVTISGTAPGAGGSVIGLGEVTGRIVPAVGD